MGFDMKARGQHRTRRVKTVGRVLALAAGLASVALVATGCSSGGTGSSASASGTIQLWARDSEQGFISQLADLYNKSHTAKVKVTIIPSGTFVQKLGTAAGSGSGPDVASIDLVFAPYFASRGALMDITDVADSLSYKKDLSPSHLKQGTWEGKVYALPFTAETSAMYYNKSLFQKAGITAPPTTYAELRDDAKKVTQLGGGTYGFTFAGACGGCNVFEFSPHIWASGGDLLASNGKKATFDTPEVKDALGLYRSMVEDGSVPAAAKTDAGTQQIPLFTSGKIGMTPLGAFAIPTMAKSGVDYGVFPLPGKSGGTGTFAGGDVISVLNGAKNAAGAKDFVKWATSDQAQTFLAKGGSMPVRTDLIPKIYETQGEAYKQFGELLKIGKTPYSLSENAIFNDNNGPWTAMINQAVFGSSVDGATSSGQKDAQSLIDAG